MSEKPTLDYASPEPKIALSERPYFPVLCGILLLMATAMFGIFLLIITSP